MFRQLDKKFTATYRTRRIITMFTRVLHLALSRARSVHVISPSFCKTHSNIILPSTSRSSMRSLPFKYPHQPLHAFLFYTICARYDFITYTVSTMNLYVEFPDKFHSLCNRNLENYCKIKKFATAEISALLHIFPINEREIVK